MRDLFFYTLLLDDLQYKQILGARFVALYRRIVDDFLMDDAEPDFSIIYVSLQLFTTPTIAAYLVTEHKLLTTLIETLYAYFEQALWPAHEVRLLARRTPSRARARAARAPQRSWAGVVLTATKQCAAHKDLVDHSAHHGPACSWRTRQLRTKAAVTAISSTTCATFWPSGQFKSTL